MRRFKTKPNKTIFTKKLMIILVDFDRTLYDTDRTWRDKKDVYILHGIDVGKCEELYQQKEC